MKIRLNELHIESNLRGVFKGLYVITKIVLITGGSRGIGKSITLSAAKRGIDVILTYNSNPEQGRVVANEINNGGGKAFALYLDTSKINTFDGFAGQALLLYKLPFYGNDRS